MSRCGPAVFSNACCPNLNIHRSPTLGRPPYQRCSNNTGVLRTGSNNSPRLAVCSGESRGSATNERPIPERRTSYKKDGTCAFCRVRERIRATARERPRRSRAECTSNTAVKSNQNVQGFGPRKSASQLDWRFTGIRCAERPLARFRPKHCNMIMRTHVFLTKISLHTNFFV